MNSHLQAVQAIASGIHAVPSTTSAFAATQGAHRFLNNERVTLRSLAKPLIEVGLHKVTNACDRYAMVAHDWSQLMYKDHTAKRDRIMLSSKHVPEGYELQTALLLSDRDGSPLAPVAMSLRTADGVHCSRCWKVRQAASPVDAATVALWYYWGGVLRPISNCSSPVE